MICRLAVIVAIFGCAILYEPQIVMRQVQFGIENGQLKWNSQQIGKGEMKSDFQWIGKGAGVAHTSFVF